MSTEQQIADPIMREWFEFIDNCANGIYTRDRHPVTLEKLDEE